jgi:hypothetical protein
MRLRSSKKIKALVMAAYPNAESFRGIEYDAVWEEYRNNADAWDSLRDSICFASKITGSKCVCDTDPRLKNSQVRLAFEASVKRVNELDNRAYAKLTAARKELENIYVRVNELKASFKG